MNIRDQLFEYIRASEIEDVAVLFIENEVYDPANEDFRREIESYLRQVYEGIYLFGCLETESSPDDWKNGILYIRVASLGESFLLKISPVDGGYMVNRE